MGCEECVDFAYFLLGLIVGIMIGYVGGLIDRSNGWWF